LTTPIVAGSAIQGVVASPTEQPIVVAFADKLVIANAAADQIASAVSAEPVVLGIAEDRVCGETPNHVLHAQDDVVPPACRQPLRQIDNNRWHAVGVGEGVASKTTHDPISAVPGT
jgi:hypothetical protein